MTSVDTSDTTICIERTLPAPPHAVYRAWLEPDLVRRWMDPSGARLIRVEIDERPGGAYRTWKADESGQIIGGFDSELLELSEDQRLVFRWGFIGPERRNGPFFETVLTITLRPDSNGTVLSLVHEDLSELAAAMPDIAQAVPDGWESFLDNLAVVVSSSGGPGVNRRAPIDCDEEERRIAPRYLAAGDPTGWFEELYTAGESGRITMPWSRTEPHLLLVDWAESRNLLGNGRSAIVVGCGLGADAEYIAGRGFRTVGFDISRAAVRIARRRHLGSAVEYVQADLLDPPHQWLRTFDLVVEIITIQALPDPPRQQAIINVGRLVAPGGTLLVIAWRDGNDQPAPPPPWPLGRAEIDAFATDALTPVRVEALTMSGQPDEPRWRAQFRRRPPELNDPTTRRRPLPDRAAS